MYEAVQKEVEIDNKYNVFILDKSDVSKSYEAEIWRCLVQSHYDIPKYHPSENGKAIKIYRYTSFRSAFRMIKENEIAMHGFYAMNDTTEATYVSEYMGDAGHTPEIKPKYRNLINKRFMISCTELNDDLLQWRLYGDNAKGVCIVFSINEDALSGNGFILGGVKYADDKGKQMELEFWKKIHKQIKLKHNMNYMYGHLPIYSHFFKPNDYKYEKEVRLLYEYHPKTKMHQGEKEWIVAEPYGIVNPMVVFRLNKKVFPLKIEEVMLGPNTPERLLNKSQLEQLVYEKKLKIKISQSKCKVYR